jgi:hypothetical protein
VPESNILNSIRLPILVLICLICYAFFNTRLYENEYLISNYKNGNYKNSEELRVDDPLFLALTRIFRCEDYDSGGIHRVDISYFRFFLIETSEFLDVLVAPEVSGQCISEVTFRRYP